MKSNRTAWVHSVPFSAVAALLLALLGCNKMAPIQDVHGGTLQPRGEATMADVDEAIWRAGRRLGWEVQLQKPGKLLAIHRPRRHVAVVLITHDGEHFSIQYRRSENLRHDAGKIHRNYNIWVARLAEAIHEEPIRPAHGSTFEEL